MSTRPWYKRFGADFVHGAMGLSLEEKGAYSLCLDLIYDRGGPIPDDPRWLAGVCGVSVRRWNAIRKRLIETGKITADDRGLFNRRAAIELENAAKTARKLAENGAKGGNKRAENEGAHSENNDIAEAGLKHRARDHIPEAREEKKEERKKEGRAPASPAAGREIVFEGSYLRKLTADKLAEWRRSYSLLPDLLSEIQLADDHYAEKERPPKNPFFTVSAWLKRSNDWEQERRQPKDDPLRGVHFVG